MTHHGKRCRVLIIEDDYFLGDDLARALRPLGVEVIGPVPDLTDAMSLDHDGFDVAVLDINLRGDSAYPIADELMRRGKPFVFTTGYHAKSIPRRFRHIPRWEKPYRLRDVTADIEGLCSGRLRPHVAL